MQKQHSTITENLVDAQKKAEQLFLEVEKAGFIRPDRSEEEVSQDIFVLAKQLFGIRKYWHKRIVRAGKNTLLPYQENPPVLMLQADDMVFLDFGPIFDDWEADYGKTYVIGSDPVKLQLKRDTEAAFEEGKRYFQTHRDFITGSELYAFMCNFAEQNGWVFGGPHAGHLIGRFPHERIIGDGVIHYIHPMNHTPLSALDSFGDPRHWILEAHLISPEKEIGGFVEALLTL